MATKRIVMCKSAWPEDDAADFVVTDVKSGETDESALMRAAAMYSSDDEFYILEV